MEVGLRFAEERMDQYLGEGRRPFFPEKLSVDACYCYDRMSKVLTIHYRCRDGIGGVVTRLLDVYPNGDWEMWTERRDGKQEHEFVRGVGRK